MNNFFLTYCKLINIVCRRYAADNGHGGLLPTNFIFSVFKIPVQSVSWRRLYIRGIRPEKEVGVKPTENRVFCRVFST